MAVLDVDRADAQQDTAPRQSEIPSVSQPSRSLCFNASGVITSPLIRLRDIAQPTDPVSPWWDRTGGVVVGMMPLDGTEMVIEVARLVEAIASDPSAPEIVWTGPDRVRVKMIRGDDTSPPETANKILSSHDSSSAAAIGGPQSSQISPAGFVAIGESDVLVPLIPGAAAPPGSPAQLNSESSSGLGGIQRSEATGADLPELSDQESLSYQESDRLVRLIQFAIDRNDLSLRESYDIDIDPNQLQLRALTELRRVDRIEFASPPREGLLDVMVRGASSRQEVSAPVQLRLTARPLVVVPRDSLRRGHVIASSDVMLQPAPRGVAINSVITNIDDVVEMQVQNVLQKDRPIPSSSISRPILIERGDLVEVQVIGGGITVATSARSLGRGSAGDLIAVETLDPRKKVMARVARAGVVEIVTRPPRVR